MKHKTLTITVTQEDIDKGKMRDREYCPIALAASRVCPEFAGVRHGLRGIRVYPTRIVMENATDYRVCYLPGDATRFALAFDRGEEVEPFEFLLAPAIEGHLDNIIIENKEA